MGLRITKEQSAGLEEVAGKLHNTKSGIIRLAIDQLLEKVTRDKERLKVQPELPLNAVEYEQEREHLLAAEDENQ